MQPDKQSYSIDEFCAAFGVSRSTLHRLTKDGFAPRMLRVGRRVLITLDAARDWARDMEKRSTQSTPAHGGDVR